jgi:dipeptidyl aminopeptidase/acylaminoacyl peptidase
LARNGYVVLHPDYRNHAQSDRDDRDELVVRLGYVEDVINAVLAVQNSDLDFVDKEKIGMLGHSMGGGITLSVLTVAPDLVDAAVLYAPVSGDMRDSYYRWIESRVPAAEKIAQLYGKPEENPTFWDGLAAQNYYENIRAPIEIYHGTADESVPIDWSKNTEKLLIDSGKAVKLIVFDDAPHEFTRDWQNFMDSTKIFYDSLLK